MLTALIVDDEPDARRRVAGLLRLGGWQVSEAANAEDAMRMSVVADFDLVVTDVSMPGEHGPAMLRRMRRNGSTARFLVVTSDPLELPGITYVPLFTYEAMLAVANQHPLANKAYIVPEDLLTETLITYPVERDRLDIFTRFLEPADVEPAQVRTSELTVMMMQLVASGRGVCGMPHWALHEYSSRGYVKAKRLGEKGLFATLYAGIRADMLDAPYMRDFLLTAKDTSFSTLDGVSAVR